MNGISFSWDGVGLTILALSLVGIELAVNKWIRKATNTYWFWLGISIFYIVYCICICWATYWMKFAHSSFVNPTLNPKESDIISKAFMLNICPFLNFILPMTLIADPSRKTARSFAPFGVLSSLIVVMLAVPMTKDIQFNWWNIFIGTSKQADLYYFGHTFNLLLSIGILLNTPKLGWKGVLYSYGAVLGFYIYVIIVSFSLGARWQVAGVFANDFGQGGTFFFFEKVFKDNLKLAQGVFFTLLIVFMFITILLCDVCKTGYFKYGDKYSGTWWHWYDYEKNTIKEPWGWFSHQWQLKHPKKNIKLKLNKK